MQLQISKGPITAQLWNAAQDTYIISGRKEKNLASHMGFRFKNRQAELQKQVESLLKEGKMVFLHQDPKFPLRKPVIEKENSDHSIDGRSSSSSSSGSESESMEID